MYQSCVIDDAHMGFQLKGKFILNFEMVVENYEFGSLFMFTCDLCIIINDIVW